jgi:hypothetical protein
MADETVDSSVRIATVPEIREITPVYRVRNEAGDFATIPLHTDSPFESQLQREKKPPRETLTHNAVPLEFTEKPEIGTFLKDIIPGEAEVIFEVMDPKSIRHLRGEQLESVILRRLERDEAAKLLSDPNAKKEPLRRFLTPQVATKLNLQGPPPEL